MQNNLKCVLAFSVGAAVGAVVSWKLLEAKYIKISNEEIESVKELYSEKVEDIKKENEKMRDQLYRNLLDNKPSLKECASKVLDEEKETYTDYTTVETEETNDEEVDNMEKPYVITPDEFGEYHDYEEVQLRYYSDGVLTDIDDEIIEDIEDIIGYDSLDHFGEYEDFTVYVRNDVHMTDYEVILDEERYSDLYSSEG